MSDKTIIGLDFDGTCVEHNYPLIGADIGAVPTLQELGRKCRIILYTMRDKEPLAEAVKWCERNKIELWAVNNNPEQTWTTSPKVYCHMYIDDAALGTPLIYHPNRRPYVNWKEMRSLLMNRGLIRGRT